MSKILQRLVDTDPRFDELSIENNWDEKRPDYWLYLSRGWVMDDNSDCHQIHEATVDEVLAKIVDVARATPDNDSNEANWRHAVELSDEDRKVIKKTDAMAKKAEKRVAKKQKEEWENRGIFYETQVHYMDKKKCIVLCYKHRTKRLTKAHEQYRSSYPSITYKCKETDNIFYFREEVARSDEYDYELNKLKKQTALAFEKKFPDEAEIQELRKRIKKTGTTPSVKLSLDKLRELAKLLNA